MRALFIALIGNALIGNAQQLPPELERACPGSKRSDWTAPDVSAPAHRFDVALPWLPASSQSIRITAWRTLCPGSATRQRVWLRFSEPTYSRRFVVPQATIIQHNRIIGRITLRPSFSHFKIVNDTDTPELVGVTGYFHGALVNDNLAESFDPSAAFSMLLTERAFESEARSVRIEIPASTVPGNIGFIPKAIAGHWWNPAQPGTGLILARNERETLFATWMTFDDSGRTTWFVMPEGLPTATGSIDGLVYSPTGPAYPYGSAFSPEQGSQLGPPVGRFSFRFLGARAEFNWSVHGASGTEDIRQILINPLNDLYISDDGVWLSPNASGWGVGISGRTAEPQTAVHTTLLTYDDAGAPVWYFSPLEDRGQSRLLGYAWAVGLPLFAPIKSGWVYQPTGPSYRRTVQPSQFQIGQPVGVLDALPVGIVNWGGDSSIAREKLFIYTIRGQRMELGIQQFRFEY